MKIKKKNCARESKGLWLACLNFHLYLSKDSVLSTMHGAKAFKDFVDKKCTRVPEFLQVVAEAQQENNRAADTDEGLDRRKSRGLTITSQAGVQS